MSIRVATNTVEAVLDQYQRDLSDLYGASEVRAIAFAVFRDRLGWDAAAVLLNRPGPLSESELLSVYLPLKRLRTGEPLQYVLGYTGFHGLRIQVDPAVLIPRPETEELVDLIIRAQQRSPERILDIGTGSGCIALALKNAFPMAEVFGLDADERALAVAARNAEANSLLVEWALIDILDDRLAPPTAGLIVSNPPYVPRSEAASLAPNVRDHEPHLALFVEDDDPLLFYRAIGRRALTLLPAGGQLWFEGHYIHTPEAADLLRAMGFPQVQVLNDLSGTPRFIRARR